MVYKIELQSVPRFLFCCSVTVDNYKNEFRNRANFLEISLVENGRIKAYENGEKYIIEPHTLNIITSDRNCVFSAEKNEIQRHSTVGVGAEYKITRCTLEEAKKSGIEENVLFLKHLTKLDNTRYDSILMKIKKVAALYNSFGRTNKLSAVAAWYDLCAEVSAITLFEAEDCNCSPSARLYAQQVWKYISEHLSERISVIDMAESLEISEGYMQNMFKKVTGKSIIEYANEYKIKTAAEMMKAYNMKLKDIAPRIGIEDAAYMSRLFKKVMGISFEEYRKNIDSIERN